MKKNKFLDIALILFLTFDAWATFINNVMKIVIGDNFIDSILVFSLMGLLTISILIIYRELLDIKLFITFLLMIITFLISIAMNPSILVKLSISEYIIIGYAVLGTLYGKIIYLSRDRIYKVLRISAYISFLLLFFHPFWFRSIVFEFSNGVIISGFMNFGYKMLLPTLLFMYLFLRYKNKSDLVMALISLMYLFIFGNRGVILSVIVLLALSFIFLGNKTLTLRKFMILMTTLVVLVSIFYAQSFWNFIYDSITRIGINSDFLLRVIEGDLLNNNRADIYNAITKSFENISIFPRGLFGDRFLLEELIGEFIYAHNIILELLVQFGLITVVVLILLFITQILVLWSKGTPNDKALFVLLFSLIIPKLFVSSSYLYEPLFFGLLGYIFYIKKKGYIHE